MPSVDEPVRALRRLLRADPDFAVEPRRLGRGLLDLLPHDDRSVRLLKVAAEVGVPALVHDGLLQDARRALMDRAGLHAEAAAWVIEVWRAAGVDEPLNGFGAVRLAAWPDGALLVVTRDSRGVFGATVGRSGPSPWRMLAAGSGAGELAVSAEGARIVVVWVQKEAVYAVEARRENGTLAANPPEPVAEPRAGLAPDTPLAIVAVDETLNHLVWTRGRGLLRRGTWRAWPADDPDDDLSPVGAAVTALDVGRPSPDAAVLFAATDRGRVLAAGWDLAGDQVSAWRPLALPASAVGLAAAGHRVYVATVDGQTLDEAGAVVHPEPVVAATAAGGTAWLATVAAGTMTLSRPDSGGVWSLPVP